MLIDRESLYFKHSVFSFFFFSFFFALFFVCVNQTWKVEKRFSTLLLRILLHKYKFLLMKKRSHKLIKEKCPYNCNECGIYTLTSSINMRIYRWNEWDKSDDTFHFVCVSKLKCSFLFWFVEFTNELMQLLNSREQYLAFERVKFQWFFYFVAC